MATHEMARFAMKHVMEGCGSTSHLNVLGTLLSLNGQLFYYDLNENAISLYFIKKNKKCSYIIY